MKIKIELQGREIELTIDEARQVYSDLQKIFYQHRQPIFPNVYGPIKPFEPCYDGNWTVAI